MKNYLFTFVEYVSLSFYVEITIKLKIAFFENKNVHIIGTILKLISIWSSDQRRENQINQTSQLVHTTAARHKIL